MNLNFDLSQLREIDFNDVARWPRPIKAAAIVLLSVAVLGAGLWLDTKKQFESLETTRQQEKVLKDEFLVKQAKAANLDAYKAQMEEMRRSFGAMLRQLPSRTEVAELLVDVSQTGLQSGLEFELFKPEAERPADFYAELPIKMKVAGSYHEFGRFVSDVAALSRIVTLQDFTVGTRQTAAARDPKATRSIEDPLVMEVTARTYRYLEDEELLQEEE
ncbi:MAG: type 4a pilus biogenesis protein PilO [Gammaproteobacteria bacterium]|jgi:type IV pilus assembly protein PilO|nr:type 4a pilus biogenesis protein PilO [Gammaproteobacteria bacterium]